MMTFGFLTINFRRPQILKLFCASIKRLRAEVGINFPVICVSEAVDATICSQYEIGHIVYPNTPSSEKWNVGCEYLRQIGVDYVVVMGSDDIMSTQCLRNIMSEMDNDVDVIGVKGLYVYDTDGDYRGTLKHITSKKLLGVGKTINKRVLDAVNWRPWECSVPRNSGTDAVASRNIFPYVKTTAVVEGVIVDCKSKESLNKFTMFHTNSHGQDSDKNIFYNILSREELEILHSIRQVGLPIKFPNLQKKGRTLI